MPVPGRSPSSDADRAWTFPGEDPGPNSVSVKAKFDFTGSHVSEPEAGATRLNYRFEVDSGMGGVFGKLADPLVQRPAPAWCEQIWMPALLIC